MPGSSDDIDNPSPLLGAHGRQHELGKSGVTELLQCDRVLPLGKVDAVDAVLGCRSRVVHQDIDRSTKLLRGLLDRVDDRFGHGRIGRHGNHTPPTGSRDIVRGPPQRIFGSRHHGDVATLARQLLRDGPSDAKARSGDESPPAFDKEIHVSSP